MKFFLSLFFLMFVYCHQANSSADDFKKYFVVDLDAPVPDLKVLEKELEQATQIYEPRYMLSWDMGSVFDKVWKGVITSFGTSEKHLSTPTEDQLYDMIKMTPKEFYPYIGPYLHTLPNIPDRVLMMPGIKETKNKFPERIAPQLQGIENLEFLSPHLYILLMPEMWPENHPPKEKMQQRPAKIPPVKLSPELFKKALDNTPEGGFGGSFDTNNKPGPDKLITLNITKNSPLTTGDIRAFLRTIDAVQEFASLSNILKIMHAGDLLNYWEQKNGMAIPLNGLKDGVNPCQRLVLKIRWAGLEDKFIQAIGIEGFNANEWAYTCDKTIKAYRISRISSAQINAIKSFKQKIYDSYFDTLKPLYRDNQYATIQSLIQMHVAPRSDVLEAMKNEKLIRDKIAPLGGKLIISPILN